MRHTYLSVLNKEGGVVSVLVKDGGVTFVSVHFSERRRHGLCVLVKDGGVVSVSVKEFVNVNLNNSKLTHFFP